ncbi:MarR family winged helix-turn-helix transcriptional regulator [Paenibacillus macerans]|uniref:MarR family winged helix-turn-helix transcriptional regulator n=1 Tax=Paenibacillus macerans TaxID=44252 RepID=UPI003D30F229
MDQKSLETIELQMAILYRRITTVTAAKKTGNLDRSAYLLLHQIIAYGSVGVKALADEFQLDISTVSRQAASLEHKGYVRRKPDPDDRRAYFLETTELGANEYHAYKQGRINRIQELIDDWPEEETALFASLLQKFNQAIIKQADR